jgi:starch phosphorylase
MSIKDTPGNRALQRIVQCRYLPAHLRQPEERISIMKILGHLTVRPRLPERLARLDELAGNLFWTWDAASRDLFRRLDPGLWQESGQGPAGVLQRVSEERLQQAAQDNDFIAAYDSVIAAFDEYLTGAGPSWFAGRIGSQDVYAYFCAEYGWHESLPLYSGGLGVLAGDHTKAASDLGVPLVGVGLWYPEGYFQQRVSADGRQQAAYRAADPLDLPLERVRDGSGSEVRVAVPLFGREVWLAAWRVKVGRNSVYLLDPDLPENPVADRAILRRLYGGDQRTRIAQEVILGIGGVRLLRKLGISPAAWHMNEGHSAFMVLERCRELLGDGLTLAEARAVVAASTVFTVHTPVAAGNDAFDFALVGECFAGYWSELGLDQARFNDLARADHGWGDVFSMPALALRFSSGRNGVSALHGDTTRRMWSKLWPGVPVAEVPIGHITNGVHLKTWMARQMQDLVSTVLPAGWREEPAEAEMWQRVRSIPERDFWQVRRSIKQQALASLRERAVRQLERRHALPVELQQAAALFDADHLLIGFARRFATYKRATLIFSDPERLERLLNDAGRPVQLVFAGKAHPADLPGQEFISKIQQLSLDPRFAGRILFLEDYDMALGRVLTRGVDVWLNNPRRPLEASGTSGEKAALNGILNLSVPDGWWPEGFDGRNGWAFGSTAPQGADSSERVDAVDAAELYELLEHEVVPLYYSRNEEGIPLDWVRRSRDAVASITPAFNAQRMVRDYVVQLYAPAAARASVMAAADHLAARELAGWKARLAAAWDGVHLSASVSAGGGVEQDSSVSVSALLSGVPAGLEMSVELVYSREDDALEEQLRTVPLTSDAAGGAGGSRWQATFRPELTGRLVYGVRAWPVNDLLASPFESGFICWADPAAG